MNELAMTTRLEREARRNRWYETHLPPSAGHQKQLQTDYLNVPWIVCVKSQGPSFLENLKLLLIAIRDMPCLGLRKLWKS